MGSREPHKWKIKCLWVEKKILIFRVETYFVLGGEIKFLNFIDQEHQSKHIPGNCPPFPPPKRHISISEKFEFKAKSCKEEKKGIL